MNMPLAIVVIVVFIVIYTFHDNKNVNKKEKEKDALTVLGERLDAAEKRIDRLEGTVKWLGGDFPVDDSAEDDSQPTNPV